MILHVIEAIVLIYLALVVIQFVLLAWASEHAPIIEYVPRCPDFVPPEWEHPDRVN